MSVGLYDVKSQKEAYVSEAEAQKGIQEGRLSPGKTTTYNMVKPDGAATGVPGTDVHLALANGWRFETAKEKKTNDYLEDNQGLKGGLKAAGASALREATFGVVDAARGDEQLQALQAANPVASGIGATAGFAGSMLYGGGAFKGAQLAGRAAETAVMGARGAEAIGLGSRIARAAVRTGVESAALSAPRALSEAVMGDPDEAAETLLWSLGTGAVLGAGGAVIKAGAQRSVDGAKAGWKAATGEEMTGASMGKVLQQRAAQAEKNIAAGESLSLSNVLLGKDSSEGLTNVLLATAHPGAYAAKVAKGLLTSEEAIAKYGNQLGLALTDGALDRAAQKLSTVGSALRKSTLAASIAAKPRDVFSDFLGERQGDDRKGFDNVADSIARLASSPDGGSENSAGNLIQDGAPETATSLAIARQRALKYLTEVLPRPASQPDPLSDDKWKPSKAQVSDFASKLQVVMDPMTVITKLGNGTLSPADVQALNAVYPKLSLYFQQELMMSLGDDKVRRSLSATRRAKVRLLLGQGASLGPSNVPQFQALYNKAATGPATGNGAKPRKLNVSKLPGMEPTTEQRLSSAQ